MGRLLVLVFMLPWWAYIPASLGALWLGERTYEQALETEAEKAAALEAGAPAPVDLGSFDRSRDMHAADEVHVTGWIDPDLNYELVKRRNGVVTGTRHMYMMFGSDDPAGAPQVRAALMLTKKEQELFLDRGEEFITGFTDAGELEFAFNGFADTHVTQSDMAAEAIEEQGRVKSEDFIFVEPFFEGREAALTPRGVPDQTRYVGWAIAAFVALIGVVKRVRSVRARPSREELEAAALAEAEEPAPVFEPAKSFAVPDGVSADTPLGRLARRNAGSAEPVFREEPAYSVYGAAGLDPVFADEDAAEEPIGARPLDTSDVDDGARGGAEAESRFPPVPDDSRFPPVPGDGPEAVEANGTSALGFYLKLGIAMLVVGGIAYKPTLLSAGLPFAGIALFWLGVYVVFQKIRNAGRRGDGGENAPQHQRRPEAAA